MRTSFQAMPVSFQVMLQDSQTMLRSLEVYATQYLR